jgi:hypothetical protein
MFQRRARRTIWTCAESRTRIVARDPSNSARRVVAAPWWAQVITTSEVIMNSTSRHLTRISGLVATIVGTMVFTASQAAAMRPAPDPGPGTARATAGTGSQSVLRVTDSSISGVQWVLFAVLVVAAIAIGAALTHLAQRRRTRLALR